MGVTKGDTRSLDEPAGFAKIRRSAEPNVGVWLCLRAFGGPSSIVSLLSSLGLYKG